MSNKEIYSKKQVLDAGIEFSLNREIEHLKKLVKRSELAYEKIQECKQLQKENQQLRMEIEVLLKCEEEELF